jgi:Na+/melibiose symporter-like transporter
MKQKLDIKRIALVSLIYCSLDVMWMIYNSYVPVYLQAGNPGFTEAGAGVLGFGIAPAITGFLMTLDNIGALILSPFIGILSDSSKSKMGRRISFILFSMPFMVAALVVIPLMVQNIPPESSGNTAALTGRLIPFMASLVVLLLANAVMFGPGRVMLFDITPL